MAKYQNELENFIKTKREVKDLIDSFPQDKREIIMFDKWSLKDVVAHLSHWMEDDLSALNNLMNGKNSYWYPDVDKFNEEGVNKRRNKTWDEVYLEFTRLINDLDAAYNKLSDEQFEQEMWQNLKGTPLRSIKVDIEHWREEHIPSLMKKVEMIGQENLPGS
jgi:hypothetical protein